VERLMQLGIPATTSIGGARKWSKYGYPNYLADLSNFRVVLCPDADRGGIFHMLEIERSLRTAGIEVAGWLLAPPDAPWESLPDSGGLDVVDWLENGATAKQILDSVRVALPDYLAEDEATDLGTEENDTRNGKKKPVAQLLIELALELGTLWHDSAGTGWVDYIVDGNLQTARIRSKQFRSFLSRIFWKRERRSYSSEAWSEAANFLEDLACDGPQRDAFLRVGKHENCIYIDLGTDDWRVVRVSPDGWEILPYSACPIRFYRTDCQLPLPIPTRGGSLDDLWQLLNVKDADRPLVIGWILSTLTPDGSKPILCFSGEKGAGKSSAAVLLKRLTDPTRVSKASTVGDLRQVAAAAMGRWVLCFDNLTHLSPEQQDLLCCISTGAGYSHRTLYSDLDETFLEFRRPQILTGIDLVPTRSDLLDRCLIVRLERISEEDRLTEEELETLTVSLLPGIYGALLDVLVVALRNLPTTKPAKLPRMADFARICIAAGIPDFVEAYTTNIEIGYQAAVEASPIAEGIVSLLDTHNGYWQGTTTELIQQLQELDPTSREFQKLSARSVGRRLATSLRGDLAAVGIEVDQGKGNKGQRYLILSRVAEPQKTVPHSPPVSPVQDNGVTVLNASSSTSAPEEKKAPVAVTVNGRANATEGRVSVSSPPTSNTAREEDHISNKEWNSLLDACCRAGVPHWQLRDVISAAAGIPKRDVGVAPLTRAQYRRALAYLAHYPNGAAAAAAAPTSTQTRLPVASSAHEGVSPWEWER